jgi:hypothetical protein
VVQAFEDPKAIAEEVRVQLLIVSNRLPRFGDHGLGGLKDRLRAGKLSICTGTNRRIFALLDQPPPQGYA